MKKITKRFLFTSFGILLIAISGCSKDDNTGESTLQVDKGSITGSVTFKTGLAATQTVNEPKNFRDASLNETLKYSYVVTIDKPQTVDIHVKVTQASGSATAGSDFRFDNDLLIPAFKTSVEGTITILSDAIAEGDEDFTLQIGTASTSNANVVSSSVSFIIKNFLSPDLELTFDYNQTLNYYQVPSSFTLYNFSANANPWDMDYYVFDFQGNDTGITAAATAAEPERLVISDAMFLADGITPNPDYLADGVYYVNYLVYRNFFSAVPLNPLLEGYGIVKVPTTVSYLRRGGINAGTFAQEKDFIPSAYSPQDDTNFVIGIKKQNGVYSLFNSTYSDGDPNSPPPFVSGRVASIQEKIKVAMVTTRKNHRN